MAGSVIQATGKMEFEDSLRQVFPLEEAAGAIVVTALSPGSSAIPSIGVG